MNSCEILRTKMDAWLDGELSPADAEIVRLHVEACADCREERRQLERLQTSLQAVLTSGTAKPDFGPLWQGIEQRITRKRSWYLELYDWTRAVLTAPRLAWAVPSIIVLVLAGLATDRFWTGMRTVAPRDNFAAVESIDSYGRSVALLRDSETRTTVIWLYQNQENENESPAETTDPQPSF